jgi:hypothetical protein
MIDLRYSLLCEDEVTRIAISILFERMVQGMVACFFDEAYFKQFKCLNNKDVLKALPQASAFALLPQYNLDLLLAGIDYDDRPRNNFDKELALLYDRVEHVAKNKTIIFFPVQAIEHWLYMLLYKMENPTSTKNISASVENISRNELKSKLYKKGNSKTDIVQSVAQSGDIHWLVERSHSFKIFFQQVIHFARTV